MTVTTPSAPPVDTGYPAIRTVGVDGFLVSFAGRLEERANRAALAFRAVVERENWPGVEECATSLVSAFLRFDLAGSDHDSLRARLETLLASRDWYDAPLPGGRRLWRVPVVFGGKNGPHLADAAALAGQSVEQAIATLCAAPVRVQTIGFAPGQPYLGQLPENWDIPRQTSLTPLVPQGALVVAIRQLIVFSVGMPTGWRQIGQTGLRLFRPDTPDPFLLRPGDEVLFHPAHDLDRLRAAPDGGAVAEALA
ncbi:MAG: Allophanate hydrolase subunit 1 [Roseibaca calidilacus]|uniref:Allophanate hydrolase subunit 1 n=1 Tax=Roseibaca calidilacus TaxID=1666912 RepID=A0A0P7WSC9_9RHOB|nr:carboxyltransferase domain-containing protein [Roseibaca calidilacus]KPP93600.1 MAG: Allophanate hydrolase subunit 1 [Roseibaca calidilacus]CUX80393.1 sensor histidine kinase inhibitor, KipI family [Roseibaca calidilacus]